MTEDDARQLSTALHNLRDRVNAGDYPRHGICLSIEDALPFNRGPHIRDWMQLTMHNWPHAERGKDRDNGFVVPAVDCANAEAEYMHNLNNETMWTGTYGNLRRNLLDFLIEEVDKLL